MEQKWIKQLGTTGWDHANGIATDSNNNVYITGTTSGYLGMIKMLYQMVYLMFF